MRASRCGLRSARFALENHFADFKPRDAFLFDEHPHWFVGHMSRGRVKIQQKMKDVDVLLEVRDARAPFTSAQFELTENVGDRVQRLVVLNKADLVTPNVGMATRNLIEEAGQPCLLTNASEKKNLIKIKEFALDQCRARHPRTLGLMMMVVGLPNTGKSTIITGLKRIAFGTARQQGRGSKLMHGVKHTEAKASGKPGETRDVTFFQLTNHPRLYCYDTPGVSLYKKKNDPERNTKLALISSMPDHFAGEMYLADYLLYKLNQAQLFNYVEELGLSGPTDDIRFLTAHIAATLRQKRMTPAEISSINVTRGAQFFLNLFRHGKMGKLCIDHIPGAEEVQRLRQLQVQTEPPGPWGPPCYPEVPRGLELNRRGPILPADFVPRRKRRGAESDDEDTNDIDASGYTDGYSSGYGSINRRRP